MYVLGSTKSKKCFSIEATNLVLLYSYLYSHLDHKGVVESMVYQAKAVVAEICDYFPKSRLEQIKCEPIIAEKAEYGLAQFELSFSGGRDIYN